MMINRRKFLSTAAPAAVAAVSTSTGPAWSGNVRDDDWAPPHFTLDVASVVRDGYAHVGHNELGILFVPVCEYVGESPERVRELIAFRAGELRFSGLMSDRPPTRLLMVPDGPLKKRGDGTWSMRVGLYGV